MAYTICNIQYTIYAIYNNYYIILCRRYGNGKYTGLNYSFFFPGFMVDIQPTPVVYKEVLLLHKVEGYNDHGVRFELGKVWVRCGQGRACGERGVWRFINSYQYQYQYYYAVVFEL